MDHHETLSLAIDAKARADRLYMHYALALAIILTLAGLSLVILGIGGHLDIVITGQGDLEARLINASPGVVLWLIGAFLFWWSRPRAIKSRSQTETLSRGHETTTANNTSRGPFLTKNVGLSPRTGKEIRAFSGRYGSYLLDEEVHVPLPLELDPNQITLGFAVDLLEQKRRYLSDMSAEMSRDGITLITDFGKSPFHENSIVLMRLGDEKPFVGDGVKHATIPANIDPKSLTRYDAIEMLMTDSAKVFSPVGSIRPDSPSPVVSQRHDSFIELYQSGPKRDDGATGED